MARLFADFAAPTAAETGVTDRVGGAVDDVDDADAAGAALL